MIDIKIFEDNSPSTIFSSLTGSIFCRLTVPAVSRTGTFFVVFRRNIPSDRKDGCSIFFFVFCMLGETKAALQQPLASASFFSRVILVNVFCLMKRLFRSAFVSIKRSQKQKLERKQKYQRNSVVGIIKRAAKSFETVYSSQLAQLVRASICS